MINIRPAKDSDMSAVAALEQECFTDAWSEALISNMFSNSYDKIYVLTADDSEIDSSDNGDTGEKVLGYINTRDIGGDVDLMALCVSPVHRNKGYAGMLIERILQEPYKQIILEVRESNAPAIHLYEKYGFEKYARRERYYTSPVEDAIIMIKKC